MYHNLFKHLSLWFPISCYSKQCHLKDACLFYANMFSHVMTHVNIFLQYVPGSTVAGSKGCTCKLFIDLDKWSSHKSVPLFAPPMSLFPQSLASIGYYLKYCISLLSDVSTPNEVNQKHLKLVIFSLSSLDRIHLLKNGDVQVMQTLPIFLRNVFHTLSLIMPLLWSIFYRLQENHLYHVINPGKLPGGASGNWSGSLDLVTSNPQTSPLCQPLLLSC